MSYNKLLPITFSMLFIFFCSCNNEFSKYKKSGKNDVEEDHLVGNVKSVTSYYDGEIADIQKYNKYGFITEYIDYRDGEVFEKTTYTYNEFGKVVCKETKNKEWHKAEMTKFDEYGNEIEEFEEVLEVYDVNTNMTIGKRLLYTYENNYDKLGGLVSRKCFRRNGTCQIEMQYNQAGKISKITEYDENGSVSEYIDYLYRGDVVLIEEKKTYPKCHLMYSIVYYNQQGEIEKWAKLYEDNSICEVREYIYDHQGYGIKEICTWVVSGSWVPGLKPGDICHTIRLYNRDEHGSLLKETKMTYYPNEDMSVLKEAEETKNFQYKYDNQGNVIYEKDDEGHEYKYEITYY